MLFEAVAVLCAGLFAGAAIYITLVEHPARLECGTELAATEFGPSYRRATLMQASLAAVGLIAAVLAWAQGRGVPVLVGGVLLGLVIPFTLIVILPTNKRLLDPGLDRGSVDAAALLARWGQLHAVRSVLGALAFGVLTLAAITPVHAQDESQMTAEIKALVAQYDSAWNRRDTSAVSRLLASRYQYFTSQGGISSRPETLAFLSSPDYVLKYAKRSEISVSLSGPVAVVSSRWQGQGTYRGKAFKDDQRCGQTWLRTSRAWQLVSEHCVQIAPAAPTSSS
jgi:Domain of unknown function (DUF4440)/Anthrone oxygenase